MYITTKKSVKFPPKFTPCFTNSFYCLLGLGQFPLGPGHCRPVFDHGCRLVAPASLANRLLFTRPREDELFLM